MQLRNSVKRFCIMFAAQFVLYGMLCWNYRAVAKAWIPEVVVSDGLIAAMNFTLIKRMVKDESKSGLAGYVIGGMSGSAVSVALTKYLWGS